MTKTEKATTPETGVPVDQAAVAEPTQHSFPTQQTEAPKYVVAKDELFVGGVRAHNVGDLVPVDNVERNGWADKVKPA